MASITQVYSNDSGRTAAAHAPCNSRATCRHRKHGFGRKQKHGTARWPITWKVAGREVRVGST